MQESHSTSICEGEWKSQWDGDILFSHGNSNARGVMICFTKNFDCKIESVSTDNDGRVLLVEMSKDNERFLLVNFYNANNENDQLLALKSLDSLLSKIDFEKNFKPIWMGDMNVIFDVHLDSLGGNPSLKKKSLAFFSKLLAKLDVSDIFRLRFPGDKRYTFRQKIGGSVIHRRLDYIFLCNSLQEQASNIQILPSFLSDHSPVFFTLHNGVDNSRGRGLWKFNNSLLLDKFFEEGIIHTISDTLTTNSNFDPHLTWEILKYEMRKFSIKFSKIKSSTSKLDKEKHENNIKAYESNPIDSSITQDQYDNSKAWLDNWYEEYTKGVILRSKSDWYEMGEKSTKYFLNLEKKNSITNTIRKLSINNIETQNDEEILDHAKSFYENLFKRKSTKTLADCAEFLSNIATPSISEANSAFCDRDLNIDELSNSLDGMKTGKTPGNDGLTIEFYKHFWQHLKQPLFNSVLHSRIKGFLSVSQRQAIIKLLEKKDKDKRYIENWRPISLLNVDTKIISKAFANRLKVVLPEIISHDQTAYVQGRFIGESTRLIADILEVTDLYNISGYILTADIEKAFDSMDHTFLIAALSKFGFGPNFICWINILLSGSESCVINGGKTSKYFKLLRGARQGDPIAAYLFIIALEVFFIMLRSNTEIKQLNIFNHNFLLTAYADDTTFFVKSLDSVKLILDSFDRFSSFSGFRLNTSKCEVCGIGVLKGVNTALCNVKNINLMTDFIRILGYHFSYNKTLSTDKNFLSVVRKIDNLLSVWKMRKLTLIGKIVIFKTLAISQIVSISSITSLPTCILNSLITIHKDFIWDGKRPKVKHSTLVGDYCDGGLRDVDVVSKIKSLKLSWLNRLHDSNHHPWKVIPLHIFTKKFKYNSIFFPNFCWHKSMRFDKIPTFYCDILNFWKEVSAANPITSSAILSECLWNNNLLKIEDDVISPTIFGKNIGTLFVANLFSLDGNLLPWNDFCNSYGVDNKLYFTWLKIIDAVPTHWKRSIKRDIGASRIFCEFVPHLISGAKLYPMSKLTAKELNRFFMKSIFQPPTSQSTILTSMNAITLPWKKIYCLPYLTSVDSYSRMFQFKILHNILFLNKKLHRIGLVDSPLCSYCAQDDETFQHLFLDCSFSKSLWNDIQAFFHGRLNIPSLNLQSATLGFFDSTKDHHAFNNILLIFKLCLYQFRSKKPPTIQVFLNNLVRRESLERNVVFHNPSKVTFHNKKWNFLSFYLASQ